MSASEPALAKITLPRLRGAVARTRLFRRLDELRDVPAAWIAAPPGAGKTTLAASYAQAKRLRPLWFQVDRGDADLASFFYYLGLAAKPLPGKRRPDLPLLTPEYLGDVAGFTRRWFRELFARLPRPGLLVLDNVHEAQDAAAFSAMLRDAFEEIPQGVRVYVLSRSDPPAEMARLVANGAVAQLDWRDLRLTLVEASAIAGDRLETDEQLVSGLHAETDGWAAGLVLRLERLKRGLATGSLDAEASRQGLFDYFAGEIFAQSSEATRELLVRTAFLPFVTVGAAERLSGNADAGRLLEHLHRRNLFTARRPGETGAYQYHDLFRAFLEKTAGTQLGKDELRTLLGRSAIELEAAGQSEAAVEVLLKAEEWSQAVAMILRVAPLLGIQGRGRVLQKWLRSLPACLVAEHPWLQYWLGVALTGIDIAAARSEQERAYEAFERCGDRAGQAIAAIGALSTYTFGSEVAQVWHARLTDLFTAPRPIHDADLAVHAYGELIFHFLWCVEPTHPLLAACASRLATLLDEPIDPNTRIRASGCLASYLLAVGRRSEARALFDAVEPIVERPAVTPLMRAAWWAETMMTAQLLGLREALRRLDQAARLAREVGMPFLLPMIELRKGFFLADIGVVDALGAMPQQEMRSASGLRESEVPVWRALLLCCRKSARGEFREAVEAARDARGRTSAAITRYWSCAHLCSLLFELGKYEEAYGHLSEAENIYPVNPFVIFGSRLVLQRALLERRTGDQRWRDTLRRGWRALREAGQLSFGQNFLLVRRASELAMAEGIEVEYVRSIIRAQNVRPSSPDVPNWPWPVKVHTLGDFRVEIDDRPLAFARKAQQKPLDLVKAIIAFGGRNVSAEKLCAALWPDSEADAAQNALKVTTARLRKLFGHEDALVVQEGKLSLDEALVWTDVAAVERTLARVEQRVQRNDTSRPAVDPEELLKAYPGHFLASEAEAPWALPTRERLRARVLRMLLAFGQRLEAEERWDDARALYQRGIELDNLAEDFYRRLMVCYGRRGERANALGVYRRCRELLSIVLGVAPSPETEAVRRSIAEA